MPEKEAQRAEAKSKPRERLQRFKGAAALGRKALFPAVLCSILAIWPMLANGASAQTRKSPEKTDTRQAPIETSAIDLLDSLASKSNFDGKEAYAKVCRLASSNKGNAIFTISLEALLETILKKAAEGKNDSLGATGTKFAVYGDSGGTERSLFLSPIGDDGAQFRIMIDGDSIIIRITPASSQEDVMALQKKLYDFFNDFVNMQNLYRKTKAPRQQPQQPVNDSGVPIG